jgi:CheY-specific phosphatase CheX
MTPPVFSARPYNYSRGDAATRAGDLDHLAEVAVDVFMAAAFAFGEARALGELSDDCDDVLAARVTFRGELAAGTVGLILPRTLAALIVADILALDADELSEPQVEDAIKELANMICGRWLTLAFGERPVFPLETPQAVWGDRRLWTESRAAASGVGISVDDAPIAVTLVVDRTADSR